LIGTVGCGPSNAPPLALHDALATEGGIDIWWTAPGSAPGEEEETELDDALVSLIDAATTSIDLALYEFDLPPVQEATLDAWERGVDVRMVGDGDEVHEAGYLALEAAGIPIVSRPAGNRIMHHKFAVVDGQAVWTGSTNMSHNGIYRNDNHSIIVRSTDMADAYTWEFEEMFGGEFGRGKTALGGSREIDLADGSLQWHFSPTHDPIDVVIDAIDDADHSVAFMVFSFTRSDVVDALSRAQARGVTVLGIFDESQANGAWSVDEDTASSGIPTLIDGNENASGFSGGKLHHKVLIVDHGTDNAAVVSGSMNWSNAGTTDNDENLVLLRSPSVVTPMMAAFCELAAIATVHPDYTGALPDLCSDLDDPSDDPSDGTPTGAVVINEVRVASQGRHGVQDAFIELIAEAPTPIDLTGWEVQTDSGTVIHTFDDAHVGGGESLVLVGDGAPEDMGKQDRMNGVLFLGGIDALVLVAPDETVSDRFRIAGVRPGASLNRVFDGDPSTQPASHDQLTRSGDLASPGRRVDGRSWHQSAAPDQFSINEFLPDPEGDDLGAEYVELVNAGSAPLDIGGYTICEDSQVCHTFGEQVLLPDEAVVLYGRGDHSHVPGALLSDAGRLSLNNSGDRLIITEPSGTIHEEVSWSTSTRGTSWNRAIDADPGTGWVHHPHADHATGTLSPGTRASGRPWTEALD